MRSFANYRWVLAVTIFTAVLAVYFYRPSTAWASGPSGAAAQGPSVGKCSQGENASANATPANPDCAACVQVTTPSSASSSANNYAYYADAQFTTDALERGLNLGTLASSAGNSAMPGSKDGMLNPDWGSITMTVPIGICGTSLGFGSEGANVVAIDGYSYPGAWTTPTSEEEEKLPPPDG